MAQAVNTQPVLIRELDFGQSALPSSPRRSAMMRACTVAIAVHVAALLLVVGFQRFHRVPVGVDVAQQGIGAFVLSVPQPTATTGVKPIEKRRELPTKIARPAPQPTDAAAADDPASAEGGGQSTPIAGTQTGPMRLVSGVTAHLLKKIVPRYPSIMQSAGIAGTVVLDAIIHPDGTIGDITVLSSSAPAFAQAAVAAVKQWEYGPIPYEGIVTVTLNFSINS